MKKIWKYELKVTPSQVVKVPHQAKILSIQNQHDIVCMWYEFDLDTIDQDTLKINFYGTGHLFDELHGKYVATVQTHEGNLVWHIYISRITPYQQKRKT